MPQEGSFRAIVANVSLALSYQNEWSIATALLNCACSEGSQDTRKLTLPSFSGSPTGCSCCATAGATKNTQRKQIKIMGIAAKRFILASLRVVPSALAQGNAEKCGGGFCLAAVLVSR